MTICSRWSTPSLRPIWWARLCVCSQRKWTPWTGTASELLDRLRVFANESMTRSRDWPNSPDALANRVRRAATFLRKVGIEITFNRTPDKKRSRTISISLFQPPKIENQVSDVSEVSDQPEQSVIPKPSDELEVATDQDCVSDTSDASDTYFSLSGVRKVYTPPRGRI